MEQLGVSRIQPKVEEEREFRERLEQIIQRIY
jgi:hypothetical protein